MIERVGFGGKPRYIAAPEGVLPGCLLPGARILDHRHQPVGQVGVLDGVVASVGDSGRVVRELRSVCVLGSCRYSDQSG